MYSNSTLKHCTEYYLKNAKVDAVMSNAPKMAHFRPIIVIAAADQAHRQSVNYRALKTSACSASLP